VGNARITSGGIVHQEVFADVWPDLPYSNVSNLLWTANERSAVGQLGTDCVNFDFPHQFVSACGGSVTYVTSQLVGEHVYLLWQEEKYNGSNDLVGSIIPLEEYKSNFDNIGKSFTP
jgi:hypothetical protein